MIAHAKTAEEVIGVFTTQLIRPIELVLFALATVVFLFGIVEFLANPENEEKKTTGKRHMLWGLIGLAIMFGVNGLVRILQNFVGQIK
ncbi:MAG: hypothetical protein Q8R12_00790 [bacterium]|nr:hypothetical protein [bacterium]